MTTATLNRRSEQGFTLVELAIVMIIIGLLIGGILKGQELIANARVTSTVAQIKGIDAATTTFQDKYSGLPGDLIAANTRLPNCSAAGACAAGDGNGRINSAPGAAPGTESVQYFPHLSAADLMSGLNTNLATNTVIGGIYPAANIAGGFNVGYSVGNVALANSAAIAANTRAGHYLVLVADPNAAAPATGVITPNQAFRIDQKLDDSVPATGSVLGAGAATCVNGNIYNDAISAADCNLYIRFHQ